MDRIKKRLSTKTLITAGLLAAICLILKRFMSVMLAGGTIRLGFGNIPLELSGILLGPVIGGLTGVAEDLIGFFTNPAGGAFFPGFTLSAALTGIIPGIIFMNNKGKYPIWKIAIAVVIVNLVISLGLDTYWLSMIYNKGFMILLPGRIVARLIIAPIEVFVIYILANRIRI